jgi:hypothetical protein
MFPDGVGHLRSGDDEREREHDQDRQGDGESDRRQPHLPPPASLLDVVGAIHRADDRHHRR